MKSKIPMNPVIAENQEAISRLGDKTLGLEKQLTDLLNEIPEEKLKMVFNVLEEIVHNKVRIGELRYVIRMFESMEQAKKHE